MSKPRWLVHPTHQLEHWWGLSRVHTGSNFVALATVAWGHDNDVPWSWWPTLHIAQTAELKEWDEALVKTHGYLSWLGFTIGGLHQAKWVVPTRPTTRARRSAP